MQNISNFTRTFKAKSWLKIANKNPALFSSTYTSQKLQEINSEKNVWNYFWKFEFPALFERLAEIIFAAEIQISEKLKHKDFEHLSFPHFLKC